ncbi:citrinin biosynthesis oxidoreductase CtnB [Ilyonectria sp. MPI-CAGE-AT-0026]|nr:citrinin biosynthesis oxidoreductase CtnB [Ilyonectria sp. MPI-CAGE-AT-0026]
MAQQDLDSTVTLPRILCLHGGGVNASVFRLQSRNIIRRLAGHFRLVFVEGPFICDAHPDIIPVYGTYGPFRRWLRWLPSHQPVDSKTAINEIHLQLRNAMMKDNALGATGEWVGLMGFSQGANISASLLYTEQMLREKLRSRAFVASWRFAVLFAGRGPLSVLDNRLMAPQDVGDVAHASVEFRDWPDGLGTEHVLKVPTIHVHGMTDPGLQHHRRLLETYCEPGTTRLIEWDGDHRMPIKTADVDAVAQAILQLGRDLAIL